MRRLCGPVAWRAGVHHGSLQGRHQRQGVLQPLWHAGLHRCVRAPPFRTCSTPFACDVIDAIAWQDPHACAFRRARGRGRVVAAAHHGRGEQEGHAPVALLGRRRLRADARRAAARRARHVRGARPARRGRDAAARDWARQLGVQPRCVRRVVSFAERGGSSLHPGSLQPEQPSSVRSFSLSWNLQGGTWPGCA